MKNSYDILKSQLMRKKKVPFNSLQQKLNVNAFELKSLIIDFMVNQIQNYNFKTPCQKKQFLRRCFIYLDYDSNTISSEQRLSLIKKINDLIAAINRLIDHDIASSNYDNHLLNQDLLHVLKEDCNYTIMLLSYDLSKDDKAKQIDGNEEELYELLNYVIFKNDDLNIFKSLMKCVPFEDRETNKEIVFKVLDKYLKSEGYLNLYYREILETFLLSDKSYLDRIDMRLINQRLKQANEPQLIKAKDKATIEMIHLKYGITDDFPYNYHYDINKLKDEDFEDLTDLNLLAIDSEGTKLKENVFDLKVTDNGYILTLYVPAISLMVKEGSLVEKTAYQKGVAFANYGLFPKDFLIDCCSLDNNKDRFVIGYQFAMDESFNLKSVDSFKAKIKVRENLSPKSVLDVLEDSGNDWVTSKLHELAFLSSQLLSPSKRQTYYQIKDLNNIVNHRLNKSDYNKAGRRIVDGLTVYSNHQMAKYFLKNDWPFIFRNNDFNDDNYLIEQIMKRTSNDELKQLLDSLRVNSYFSTINTGHSGLKKDAYSQISTPCRNLAAYVCQRQIINFLIDKKIYTDEELRKLRLEFDIIASHINNRYKSNESFLEEVHKVKRKDGLHG